MIKLPYEEIILKINERTQMNVSEIEDKIDKKMKQLSGLISKEGAAHIIANELGVKLFEQLNGRLQIKNIMKGMRDVETVGKVVTNYGIKEFATAERTGKIGSLVIGDETGTIRIAAWGAQADNSANFDIGSTIKIVGGYVRENNGRPELHLNDKSQVFINPKGENIGDVVISQKIVTRKDIKDVQETDSDIELLGTIVQIFDLKFFEVCPKCGKRARPSSDLYSCAEHGNVMPSYAYLLNLVLDDGTETIRCVFFRQQVDKLLSKNQDEISRLRTNISEFDTVKNELLGSIIKVNGKANKNAMFNRVEFITNSVNSKPDPREEIKRLEAK